MENIPEDEHMEGLEENDESASSKTQDVPFLTGLNLFLLVSYLSSADECLSLEDTEKIETATTQEEPKDKLLRLRAEKRKLHEPKLAEARIQRVQTKVRDCRHNRRL